MGDHGGVYSHRQVQVLSGGTEQCQPRRVTGRFPNPAGWTFRVALGTFEHLVGRENCNRRLECEGGVERKDVK